MRILFSDIFFILAFFYFIFLRARQLENFQSFSGPLGPEINCFSPRFFSSPNAIKTRLAATRDVVSSFSNSAKNRFPPLFSPYDTHAFHENPDSFHRNYDYYYYILIVIILGGFFFVVVIFRSENIPRICFVRKKRLIF